MAELSDLDIVDANNTERFPEGQAAGTVNDGGRATEGLLARGFKDAVEGDRDSTGSANAYLVAANRTLSAYYDGMRQGFHANFANTGAATLDIDSVGAKTIKKHHDQDLASGDIEANQYVEVVYSATDDTFQMVSPLGNSPAGGGLSNVVEDTTPQLGGALDTNAFAIDESKGAPVASAASPNIWGTDGNTLHLTGSVTITGFAAAPRAGARRILIIDAAPLFTDGANLIVEGNANFQAAVGDTALVIAETTTQFRVFFKKADGTAVVRDVRGPASATNRALALYSGTTGKLLKNGPALGTAGEVLTSNGSGSDPTFQAGGATKEFFVPVSGVVVSTATYEQMGDWPVMLLDAGELAFMAFFVPTDFTSITDAVIVLRPIGSAGAAGYDINSDFGAVGESTTANSGSDTTTTYNVTAGIIFELDISGILTGLAAGDYVGIKFTGDGASDPRIMGIRFKYT